MKWMSLVAALALAVVATGCKTDPTKSTTVKGTGGKELKLTPPTDQTIKQGGTEKITVKVSRTGFDDDVAISFGQLPEGVTVAGDDHKIIRGESSKEFTLTATATAPEKQGHVVKVTAKHGDMSTSSEFKLNVKSAK